jgi:hypothetical protein
MRHLKSLIIFVFAVAFVTGCNRINTIKNLTEKVSDEVKGDRLYFCERYVTKEIGEGTKFKKGKVTVMMRI